MWWQWQAGEEKRYGSGGSVGASSTQKSSRQVCVAKVLFLFVTPEHMNGKAMKMLPVNPGEAKGSARVCGHVLCRCVKVVCVCRQGRQAVEA